MAARRRSSSSRRSTSRRTSGAGAGSTRSGGGTANRQQAGSAARAAKSRGGKATIPCPQCGTQYKIPTEHLESQIECASCHRVFIPATASRRGLSRQNPATPFLWGGGILAVMILGAMMISSNGGDDRNRRRNKDTAAAPRIETGLGNPRVRDAAAWLEALSSGNRFELARYTDIQGMRKTLGIDNIDGTAEDLEKRVLESLLTADSTRLLRDTFPTSGQIDEDEATADEGKVVLYISPDEEAESRYYDQGGGEAWVWFRFANDRARITRFDIVSPIRARAGSEPGKSKPQVGETHEVIGQAQDVEREYDGKVETVREAELKPLDHLEDTPDALRTEIDQKIAELIDLDAPGAIPNRAAMRLRDIGKPAMPRLLNKLYELPATDRNSIIQLRKVTQALEDLTGQRFGFNPSVVGSDDPAKAAAAEKMRQSALKQWYGWWADNHWREEIDYAKDKDDEALEAELEGRTSSDGGR